MILIQTWLFVQMLVFASLFYELDVLSRLYLSRLDWEDVQARFFFRRVAPNRMRNHVGIRRCANVVEDPNGKFLHLLALAEPVNRTFCEELCNIKQDHSRPGDKRMTWRSVNSSPRNLEKITTHSTVYILATIGLIIALSF